MNLEIAASAGLCWAAALGQPLRGAPQSFVGHARMPALTAAAKKSWIIRLQDEVK